MNEISKDLLQLIKDNPDLPIVPMVDAEVAGDDSGYYMGSLGEVKVDEYVISSYYYYDDRVIFKSDDDVFDALERYMSAEEFEALPDDEEDCRPYYDKLPWTKAIIVYIGTLD